MWDNNYDDILSKYQKLAYGIARLYRNKGLDWDDLKQESLIGLLKAQQNYDPGRGTEFSTYATYWIKKQLYKALTECSPSEILSETHIANLADKQTPVADSGIQLPADMPEIEKRILNLSYVQQLSLKDIAKLLNLRVERVDQTRKKALRRLRLKSDSHPLHGV